MRVALSAGGLMVTIYDAAEVEKGSKAGDKVMHRRPQTGTFSWRSLVATAVHFRVKEFMGELCLFAYIRKTPLHFVAWLTTNPLDPFRGIPLLGGGPTPSVPLLGGDRGG